MNKKNHLERFYELEKRYRDTNMLKITLGEYDIPYIYPYLSENKINEPYETFWNPQPINTVEGYFRKYLKGIIL